jgi:hypothetical protein
VVTSSSLASTRRLWALSFEVTHLSTSETTLRFVSVLSLSSGFCPEALVLALSRSFVSFIG